MIPKNLNKPPIKIEIHCTSGRPFQHISGPVAAGPYLLTLEPTSDATGTKAVLTFEDTFVHKHGHGDPLGEGRIAIDFLALLTGVSWTVTQVVFDGVAIPKRRGPLGNALPIDDNTTDHTGRIDAIMRLAEADLRQFVRACRTFNLALHTAEIDETLGFLLLVTAIESLSSMESFLPNVVLNKAKYSADRYVRFVQKYCLNIESLCGHDGEDGFIRNLKSVYHKIRSPFVHSGNEVSVASNMADGIGQASVKHFVKGKELFTPGLVWFIRVVHGTLIGFVDGFAKQADSNRDKLSEIAAMRMILTMELATDPNG